MAGDLKRWGEFGHPPKSNIRLGVFLRGIASINPCTPLYPLPLPPYPPAHRPPGGMDYIFNLNMEKTPADVSVLFRTRPPVLFIKGLKCGCVCVCW